MSSLRDDPDHWRRREAKKFVERNVRLYEKLSEWDPRCLICNHRAPTLHRRILKAWDYDDKGEFINKRYATVPYFDLFCKRHGGGE